MKKLLGLLILLFLTFGCRPSMYSEGDSVYLKPDSTEVMIRFVDPMGAIYTGVYVDGIGRRHALQFYEHEVYEPIKND